MFSLCQCVCPCQTHHVERHSEWDVPDDASPDNARKNRRRVAQSESEGVRRDTQCQRVVRVVQNLVDAQLGATKIALAGNTQEKKALQETVEDASSEQATRTNFRSRSLHTSSRCSLINMFAMNGKDVMPNLFSLCMSLTACSTSSVAP